jgi:glucosamine-phosphate N-acetyltransferase
MEILLLQPGQLTRKILSILNQLGDTQQLTLSEARLIVERQMKANHFTYVGYVEGNPVAIASIIISEKLIRNGGIAGMIEDVAVKKDEHGKGYGKVIINHLKKIAKKHKCYKAILACSDNNIGFYIKCGMEKFHNQMRVDFPESEK